MSAQGSRNRSFINDNTRTDISSDVTVYIGHIRYYFTFVPSVTDLIHICYELFIRETNSSKQSHCRLLWARYAMTTLNLSVCLFVVLNTILSTLDFYLNRFEFHVISSADQILPMIKNSSKNLATRSKFKQLIKRGFRNTTEGQTLLSCTG